MQSLKFYADQQELEDRERIAGSCYQRTSLNKNKRVHTRNEDSSSDHLISFAEKIVEKVENVIAH
jgi:hypothetical protein